MRRIPSITSMLSGLIGTPSVSSVNPQWDQGNWDVIQLLASWLEPLGFHVEIQDLKTTPRKANLIATLGKGDNGLVLAGHTDTVPYDVNDWSHDPFTLREHDGRFFGLGTCDMKGFFALAIEAASAFSAGELRQPLTILATADEESSMIGARTLVETRKPQARYAIIGEPTNLRPIRGHKGVMMESIRVIGRSGHSSDPSFGESALEGMYQVIGGLLDWRKELQNQNRNDAFGVPVPTMNLGYIHGGDNPNRICGHCELQIDLRPLPGMNPIHLRTELANRARNSVQHSTLRIETESLFPGLAPMETNADSPLVTLAEQLTGHTAGTVAFGTEGPFLAELGMDVIILGPGDIAQAHQPDEYISMDRLAPTVTLLQQFIHQFCVH